MLKFESSWRFSSPGPIAAGVYENFSEIIARVARGEQRILEHYKRYFAAAAGSTSSWSSNANWAESDLQNYMARASDNAPLFIEAFYDACEELKKIEADAPVPDHQFINRVLAKNEAGYLIEPPNLIAKVASQVSTSLPEMPLSLDQKAQETIQASFSEAKNLLAEGRHRQAVQELLWLLETISTAFQGISTQDNSSIEGKYFNKIIKELRRSNQGTTLDQVLGWITNLHGYLSAPSGGGIRHGMNLKDGMATSPSEAQLYCNLITTYISFLLSEYERLGSKASALSKESEY